MNKEPKILRTVTDRFSLFNDGRKLGANQRNYILSSVRNMFESIETQELLRTGEAYGYYGHGNRARAGKLQLGETEVININGKPVVVENVPGCRTKSISVDDNGIVTHTQEVLDTPAGRIMDSLIASGAGGWSWATGGHDTKAASYTRNYAGMDYVLQPNYLSLDHPAMMMESTNAESMILESLRSTGLDDASAALAMRMGMGDEHLAVRVTELEQDLMILESVRIENSELATKVQWHEEANQARESLLMEAINKLPVYLTDEQKQAFVRMRDEADCKVVAKMFESLGRADFNSLPLDNSHQTTQVVPKTPNGYTGSAISFSQPRRFS